MLIHETNAMRMRQNELLILHKTDSCSGRKTLAHPYYQEYIRDRAFNRVEWLTILQDRSVLIKAPIAIRGQQVILCETPTDIYKLTELKREPLI